LIVLSSPFTFFLDPGLWLSNSGVAASIFLSTLFFNRRGYTTFAGIICVVGTTFAVATPFLSGIDITTLPLLGQLVIPLVVACVVLPPEAVFVQLGVNLICISLTLLSPLNDPAIRAYVSHDMYVAFIPQVTLQINMTVIVYIIVRILLQTVRRADQAEERALPTAGG